MLHIPQHKKVAGGIAVAAVVYSLEHLLLVRNLRDTRQLLWKFGVETLEPGEGVLDGLRRLLAEEYGYADIPYQRVGGKIVRVGDDKVVVTQLGDRQLIESYTPHYRYLYKVRIPDDVLKGLSGRIVESDEDERMEIRSFDLLAPDSMNDFLPHHKQLWERFKYSD